VTATIPVPTGPWGPPLRESPHGSDELAPATRSQPSALQPPPPPPPACPADTASPGRVPAAPDTPARTASPGPWCFYRRLDTRDPVARQRIRVVAEGIIGVVLIAVIASVYGPGTGPASAWPTRGRALAGVMAAEVSQALENVQAGGPARDLSALRSSLSEARLLAPPPGAAAVAWSFALRMLTRSLAEASTGHDPAADLTAAGQALVTVLSEEPPGAQR